MAVFPRLKSINSRVVPDCRRASQAAGVIVALIGGTVLAGWALDIPALQSVFPGLSAMEANIALSFVFAGVSLWYLAKERQSRKTRYIARGGAIVVGGVGLFALSEQLYQWEVGIEQLLAPGAAGPNGVSAPPHTAPTVVLAFFLLILALILMNARGGRRVVGPLTFLSAFLLLMTLVGYLYRVNALFDSASYGQKTLHYGITLTILCAGLLFACPELGLMKVLTGKTVGSVVARRLAPAVLGLPLLVGWLILKGQRAGLYGFDLGTSLLVLSVIVVFAVMIAWGAGTLHTMDQERVRREEALRHSESLFRAVCDASPTGVFFFDTHGSVLYANPADLRMAGLSWRGRMGLYWLRAIHPEDRERVIRDWQAAVRGEKLFAAVGRYLHEDGTIIWWEAKTAPVMVGGKLLGYVGMVQDITERKQLEEARMQLSAIVESSDDAIIGAGLDGLIRSWNAGAERISGYSAEEILGLPVSILVAPERRDQVPQILEKLISGERVESRETVLVTKEGHQVDISLTVSPIKDKTGRIVGASGILRDITRQKRLEDQLRQSQKMEAIGLLAGGVAHDFNNLLTAILGYSELVLTRMAESDPARGDVDQIMKAADRAAALTDQLLSFGRKQMLQPEVLDLNQIVTNMEKMLGRVIGEDIELVVVPEPGLKRVEVDPGQIEQVIIHLAVNARDAMPQGGKLLIETRTVDPSKAAAHSPGGAPNAGFVMLTVSDTGCGMDAGTKAHLFEPFFTTKDRGRGTGLGLSTVYGIVKQSGGHIWVDSEPGKGTKFRIHLPATNKPMGRVEAGRVRAIGSRGWETVLLVEDDERLRNLVRESLHMNGYRVLEAENGREALRICERYDGTIQLVVTDVVMPVMSGGELVEQLASSYPEMRVLYMSGYTEDAIVRHGVVEKSVAFLKKPFSPDTLARKVREVLDEFGQTTRGAVPSPVSEIRRQETQI